ncbi:hypothetical protein ABW19_dt0200965 [Dactylella cylindrospora]|nr:hypothetical protein ABW19_dt0200965 [Dactylella cylindrospora]
MIPPLPLPTFSTPSPISAIIKAAESSRGSEGTSNISADTPDPASTVLQVPFISPALASSAPSPAASRYTTRLATLSDIPAITDLHFLAFGEEFEEFVPNDGDGRRWLDETYRVCLEEFAEECLTVVVVAVVGDPGGDDTVGRGGDAGDGVDIAGRDGKGIDAGIGGGDGGGMVVAYARYIVPTARVWKNMYSEPKAIGWMKQEVLDRFLGGLEEQHRSVMGVPGEGGKRHLWFENLATHPDHQKRGIGRTLVRYACDLADEMGLDTYLDASDDGMGLYERFGFLQVEGVEINRGFSAPMVRKAGARGYQRRKV